MNGGMLMSDNSGIKLDENINLNQNDVPYPLLYGGSRIEIFGNKKIHFDGSYKIIEYSSSILKIKKGKFNVAFTGNMLKIGNVEKNSFLLTGEILNISFE